ncbi:uncharacterized protein si:cabz01074946.1 isoform X2 [Poeciliopsis prolifica]|uniref:uncharacterized protein si:cabz01074946.1 isoform X2 n=1 Tax=Poeciliopsis prolifica TaxID=188132 RepID=UPI0024144E45|nr:uncharacterized protein si:cabz01074946.1 isoform X2 [Poeciliopsis prolifica]
MRLIVLFLLFQGLQVEGLNPIGPTITITGTWIATWDQAGINTERRPEYAGRLKLDTKSANLTIQNLQLRDAMTYYVELVNTTVFTLRNQVNLIVKVRLKKPTLQLYQNFTPSENGCVLVLNCSSPDPGVAFTWKVNPTCHHCSNNSLNGTSELLAFFLTTPDSVNLTCIVMRESQSRSSFLMSKIKVPRFEPPPDCGFAWGLFATLLIVIVVTSLLHFRENIINMFQRGRTNSFNPSSPESMRRAGFPNNKSPKFDMVVLKGVLCCSTVKKITPPSLF